MVNLDRCPQIDLKYAWVSDLPTSSYPLHQFYPLLLVVEAFAPTQGWWCTSLFLVVKRHHFWMTKIPSPRVLLHGRHRAVIAVTGGTNQNRCVWNLGIPQNDWFSGEKDDNPSSVVLHHISHFLTNPDVKRKIIDKLLDKSAISAMKS